MTTQTASPHHLLRAGAPTALVEARGLTAAYGAGRDRQPVLRGVDFRARAGEFVAIVGRSGSGKSTLLHCLGGLLAPDSGEVRVAGHDLVGAGRARLARLRRDHIGFVFQDLNLVSSLTAAENIRLPARLAGKRCSRAEVRRALDLVGLGHKARSLPGELSGGQRQRVAVTRTLLRRPEVVFADEPTGALDASTSDVVMGLLRRSVGPASALVMVTHDLDVAATADRVVVLDDGRTAGELVRPSAAELFGAVHRGSGTV